MAGYSRENQRQNAALQSILRGEIPEKRIFITKENLEFKKQKAPEVYNQVNPDGYTLDKEKWSINMEKIYEQADEALEYLQKIENSLL